MNRKAHWDEVYSNKSPLEVSWYQKEPALSLQLIENTGISTHAAIIDIGGGASILVDQLNERGYQHLAVLDISGNALAYMPRWTSVSEKNSTWFLLPGQSQPSLSNDISLHFRSAGLDGIAP